MKWSKRYLDIYGMQYEAINNSIFELVAKNIININSNNPIATVAIISHNDETRLLSCIWSLSENLTKYPIEIIGINNASTDNTEQIYKRVGLKYYNEPKKGFGFARQCCLDNAVGKYMICIDSDTIYPKKYIENIIDAFEKYNPVAISVQYSLIYNNWKEKYFFFIYELFRDIYNRFVCIKRPELVIRGLAFAHVVDLAKNYGYRCNILRGEDGSMAFLLSKHGKIKFLRKRSIRPLTISSLFNNSPSLLKPLLSKIGYELKNFRRYFRKLKELKDGESNLMK